MRIPQAVIGKAKKLPKQNPGFKAEMESFEEKLLATAAERKEEEATAQAIGFLASVIKDSLSN